VLFTLQDKLKTVA